jgi:predicted SAM-dependent methyltransferase
LRSVGQLSMKAEHLSGLNIGCGESKLVGMIGLDVRRTPPTDVIADTWMLPFRDGSFDYVSSSHTIEHFSHKEIPSVLSEWVRLLKEGGAIEVRCPDLRARSLLFFLNPAFHNVKNIYGG